jgi:hypothetical protein
VVFLVSKQSLAACHFTCLVKLQDPSWLLDRPAILAPPVCVRTAYGIGKKADEVRS